MGRSNTANGGNTFFDLNIQVVSTSDASYTLRAVVYLTSLNVIDSSNDLSVGGNWSRSGALALNGVYSATPVWFADIVVNRVYGSTVPVSVNASWSGVEYWGVTLSASASYTVPARPYSVPAAATGVSAARVSDTQHTVTWTNNSTGDASTAAPYTSQQVQRSTDGGAWATAVTVSGAATSWTDTTTGMDRSYAYRVVATNSSGSATSAASATVFTTPAVPGTPTAAKSGSNIVLSFTNAARHDTGVNVYASQNGGAFALLATVAAADLTGYTHTSPSSAVTWAYKVATYNGALISAQSAASNTVQLLAAPNAPTNLGPTTVRDATEPVTLTWQHNPVDTTTQTAFQVQHRASGAGSWTTVTAVTSATSAWVLPGGTYANPVTVEWQVRTRGQHATFSPYSATATLPASTRPTATISEPAAASVVVTSALTVAWAYYDAESSAQAAWQVDLLDASAVVVETKSGVGAATTTTMATVLPNATAWTVRVRVQDAAGLWSAWNTAAFTVAYALPPTPVVVPVWDPDTATVGLTVTVDDPPVSPEIAADHVNVYRSIDGGAFVLIAAGVPPNTTVTDYSPTVAGTNDYYAVAVSALPSTTQSATATVTTPEAGDPAGSVWISGGDGLSVVCRAAANPNVQITPGPAETVLHRFEGRDAPLLFESPDDSLILALEADILRVHVDAGQSSSLAEWEALASVRGPRLWRDPSGRWVKVAAAIHLSRPAGGNVGHVSVAATRVEG